MIRQLTSLAECRALWEALSPHARAWDEWDLMYAFHDEASYSLNFLAHEADGKVDGLLPLVRDNSDGSYELFGGCYPDSRVLWLRTEHFPEFFDQLPEPAVFFDLKGPWVDELLAAHPQFADNFAEIDQRYYLEPATFDYDFANHIQRFSSEKRKGFLYDLRKIREKGPVLRWSTDDESELFIQLSNQRFGADSDYATEAGKAELRRVIRELQDSNTLRTLVIDMDGRPQAVSMSAHYGNTLIALYAASNADYKNLGKLLNVETIQEGCRLRVDEINYMTGMAWKAAWNMTAEPCRTMRKPARTVTGA